VSQGGVLHKQKSPKAGLGTRKRSALFGKGPAPDLNDINNGNGYSPRQKRESSVVAREFMGLDGQKRAVGYVLGAVLGGLRKPTRREIRNRRVPKDHVVCRGKIKVGFGKE